MAGVYIPGFYMEMPEGCLFCPLMNGQWQTCKMLGDDADVPLTTRRSDCPLVPVPDHGRLIDADAMRSSMPPCFTMEEIVKAFKNAPTVIPAEKGGAE